MGVPSPELTWGCEVWAVALWGASPAVTLQFSPDEAGWTVLGQTGNCGHCWGLAGSPCPHRDWPHLGTTWGQSGDAGPHGESSTCSLLHILPLKTNSFSLRGGEAGLLPCGLVLLRPAQTVPHPFPSHVLAAGNGSSVCCAGAVSHCQPPPGSAWSTGGHQLPLPPDLCSGCSLVLQSCWLVFAHSSCAAGVRPGPGIGIHGPAEPTPH